ncbi:MAG TPA: glycosyltransferase, partial [Solirubrobacteraceae bacterium]|nr:glycosyltransferase [Solirubrobacteraceae bacterium]
MRAGPSVLRRRGAGVGGSGDHAGIDIGRTWSQTPQAATPAEFLAHVRAGRVAAHGDQGSAAKWAHAAMALAVRSLGRGDEDTPPDPAAVLTMLERVMVEGDARSGADGNDLGPADARAVLRAWLDAVELDMDERDLVAHLQADGFTHAGLERRARRCHERRLATAVRRLHTADDLLETASAIFEACVAALPYAPAGAFLSRERDRISSRDGHPTRVGVVADGLSAVHGVSRTLAELRERGVQGFEVEVIGTDACVDRRLSSVAELEVPYSGLTMGVPSVPAVVDALTEGRYHLLHVCTPGPAGAAALLTARLLGLPVAGSHHTELEAYAALRAGDPLLAAGVRAALAAFYGQCRVVLSPSETADRGLLDL